jgi:[protein-PII] uridylyltransferase
VLSASLGSHGDAAINSFVVAPRFGAPPQAGLLRQELIRAMAGEIDVLEQLDAKEREVRENQVLEDRTVAAVPVQYALAPPRVLWFDVVGGEDAQGDAIVELRAEDRLGMLSRLARVLERNGADVRWARVSTLGSSVVDAFCISMEGGGTRARREQIENAILSVVPAPEPKKEEPATE